MTERAFYCRRLAIINEILKRQKEDSVTAEGAIKLCAKQKFDLGCKSLHAYSLKLKELDRLHQPSHQPSRKGKEKETIQ